jgi:uncharacterized protein YndB with AHSA1/START domain
VGFDLRIERLIQAPRERVFAAWADPAQVRQWFTPQPLGTGECRLDFRPGGEWVHVMLMPGGQAHAMKAHYAELKAPERIVFEAQLAEMDGARIVTTVDFMAEGQATRVKVRQVFAGAIPEADARAGWTATLDQLAAVVGGA